MSDNPFIKIKTDAKGFIDRLTACGVRLEEEDRIIVDEEVRLNQSILGNYKVIQNVIFEEQVILEDFTLDLGIGFVNCEFKKEIIFKKFTTTTYDENLNFNNTSIYLKDCKGRTAVLQNVTLYRGLLFQNSEFNKIYLWGTTFGNGGVIFQETSVVDLIDVSNLISQGFKINKSTITANIRMNSVEADISFKKVKFEGWFQFFKVSAAFGIVSNFCIYENTLKFEACSIKSLSLHSDEFRRQVTMKLWEPQSQSSGFLNELYCQDTKFLEGFSLEGSDKSKLNKLTLPLTSGATGLLKIEKMILEETKFSGLNESLKILFIKIVFRNLNMIDFTNYSPITFNTCSGAIDSSLILSNVELGPTRFNQFSFDSFTTIRFSNVNLTDIVTANVDWFADEQLSIGTKEEKNKEYFQGKRDVYRQIKQALHANGNYIDSITFKARELRSYRDELKTSKSYPLSERVIMTVNRTNDYGLNWMKPVGYLIWITFGYYVFTLPLFTRLDYSTWLRNEYFIGALYTLGERFEVFFQLFNPVRKFSETYGTVSTDLLYFLDFLHRVVLSVLIYQIVKAFRKYFST